MGIQVFLGWLHHHYKVKFEANKKKGEEWIRPVFPSYLHVYMGHILIIAGFVNCILGFDLYNFIFPNDTVKSVGTIFVCIPLVGYIVLLLTEQIVIWKTNGKGFNLFGKCAQITPNQRECCSCCRRF